MFVNTTVLDAAGVEVPGPDYTWDQFLTDCEKIKAAGYSPIAAALGNIPHYWWEYAIFNHNTPANHCDIPETVDDAQGQSWVAGINDIKDLYEKGISRRTHYQQLTMIRSLLSQKIRLLS